MVRREYLDPIQYHDIEGIKYKPDVFVTLLSLIYHDIEQRFKYLVVLSKINKNQRK